MRRRTFPPALPRLAAPELTSRRDTARERGSARPLGFELSWPGVNGWSIGGIETRILVGPWVTRFPTGTFSATGQNSATELSWVRKRNSSIARRPGHTQSLAHARTLRPHL
jgi:hypothetical protein